MLFRSSLGLGALALGGFLALAITACGESESNSNSTASGGSGGTNSTGGTSSTTSNGGTSSGGTTSGGTTSGGGSAGEGGTTTSGAPQNMMCDGTLCEGLSLGIPGGPQSDACCPEDSSDEPCGIKTDFLEEYDVHLDRECQPLNSPGEFDPECPESPPLMPNPSITLPGFPGCCLPSGKCGFLLDEALLGAVQLNLGCIDSRELPNPDFDDPPDCDPAPAGAGGAP